MGYGSSPHGSSAYGSGISIGEAIALVAAALSRSSATGELVRLLQLVADGQSVSSAIASVGLSLGLVADGQSVSSADGDLVVKLINTIILEAAVLSTTSADGTVSMTIGLAGDAQSTTEADASMILAQVMVGVAESTSDATASMGLLLELFADALSRSSAETALIIVHALTRVYKYFCFERNDTTMELKRGDLALLADKFEDVFVLWKGKKCGTSAGSAHKAIPAMPDRNLRFERNMDVLVFSRGDTTLLTKKFEDVFEFWKGKKR